MKKQIVFLLLILVVFSCRQKVYIQESSNEASEMAIAMRNMVANLKEAKIALEQGRDYQLSIDNFKNHDFTDDSFHREYFNPMADAFLLSVKKFDETPSIEHYEIVVNSCKSCHISMCPGPLELIETLSY